MLKKRLAALERSANASTFATTQEVTPERVAQTLARFKEILAVEGPPMTQDEVIETFKANLRRMNDSQQRRNLN